MAKFSVYVPDQLWLEVQEQVRDLNMSHLVQHALRDLLGSDDGFDPPPAINDRLRSAGARLRREAQELYERGYEAGVEAGEHLQFSDLDRLRSSGWPLDSTLVPAGVDTTVAAALGDDTPEHPARRGFLRALRDLWALASNTRTEAT